MRGIVERLGAGERVALDELLKDRDRSVAHLQSAIERAKDELEAERYIFALESACSGEVYEPFQYLLRRSEHAIVRAECARYLGLWRDRSAATLLMMRLDEEETVMVLKQIVWALGELRDPTSARALKIFKVHASPGLRDDIDSALVKIQLR